MNVAKHLNVEWRAAKNGGGIVCDAPIENGPIGADDHDAYYGGHLLAESMAPSTILHVLLLHNTWLKRQNSQARSQWAFDAAVEIDKAAFRTAERTPEEVTAERDLATNIILKYAPIDILDGVSPGCGHPSQYLYTQDSGKHITCLLCEREQAARNVAEYERRIAGIWENRDNFCHHINLIAQLFWGHDKQCYAPSAVLRKVKELHEAAMAFLSEMHHRAEDDSGTSAERLRQALGFKDEKPSPNDALVQTLCFFASVIKSGEPWTDVCEERFKAALALAHKGVQP